MTPFNPVNMLRVGAVLHDTYRIERHLASGGFGNTYLAWNVKFDAYCAVKEFFIKGVCERDGESLTVSVSNSENTLAFGQQAVRGAVLPRVAVKVSTQRLNPWR